MNNNTLEKRIGTFTAISLVVGTIIGTGVFLKVASMSQLLLEPKMVLLALVMAGLLSLAGALTYAEIGILFPKAGGEYVYLREGYGELLAFLYGWQRLIIGSPGTIAAYSVGAATFLCSSFAWADQIGITTWAVGLIAFFSGINCLKISVGAGVQNLLTVLKVGLILFIIIGGLFFSDQGQLSNFSTIVEGGTFRWTAFGAAMIAALWAFDGWNNLPMVSGEIKNPSKNIPIALGVGVLLIVIVYVLIHLAYFYALPISELANSNSSSYPQALPAASKVAQTFMGNAGLLFLGIAMFFSAVGAMNGSVMTNARVPYALAQDGLFFKFLGKLSLSTGSPVNAILFQAVIAIAFALTGTFDQLTEYVVFASWIFYALVAYSVFIFRKKNHTPRDYKTLGYPVVPCLFVVTSLVLLINTLFESTRNSLIGLGLILLGVPLYYLFRKQAS